MPDVSTIEKKLLSLVRKAGFLRIRDSRKIGIHPEHFRRLYKKGLLQRPSRGLYVLSNTEPTVNRTLAEVAKQIPKGVICLLSALRFYGLTTQAPFEVWLAIDHKAWNPKKTYRAVRTVYFSGKAFTSGIKTHQIEGVKVKIYSPAKTVADCFKYRNKIGLDVALEALKDCLRQKKCTNDDLWKYAKICRVANVMRPYLEAMR